MLNGLSASPLARLSRVTSRADAAHYEATLQNRRLASTTVARYLQVVPHFAEWRTTTALTTAETVTSFLSTHLPACTCTCPGRRTLLGLVSARLLWRYVGHAVLASFVISAVLTPSSDPWNQVLFAGPMVALYVVGIAIAWLVAPKPGPAPPSSGSHHLRLVFAATVLDHASRRQRPHAILRRLSRARQVPS